MAASPPLPTVAELVAGAVAAAQAGAAPLAELFGSTSLDVRRKGANDFVTRADHASEEAVLAELQRRFPGHHVLSEEAGGVGCPSDYQWLVDPLDGTTNFLQGLPVFCVSIACRRGEELLAAAVLDPLSGRLFSAGKGLGATLDGAPLAVSNRPGLAGAFLATGYPFRAHAALDVYLAAFRDVFLQAGAIRRCGAAALDLAFTAAGVYDGFFEFRLSPWDIAAGALLITEAGGRVSDLDGGAGFLRSGNVIAGNPAVFGELRAAVAAHADEARLAVLTPGLDAAG